MDDQGKALLRHAPGLLGGMDIRQVAQDFEKAVRRLAASAQGHGGPARPEPAAVAPLHPAVVPAAASGERLTQLLLRHARRPILRGEEFAQMVAEHLRRRHAEHGLGTGVPGRDGSRRVRW